MIAYFKHTNGEAFTLNGDDYIGYFNVIDGVAYTGRTYSSTSELLSAKSTVISDLYVKQMEYDPSYQHIKNPIEYYTNVFDLLNRQGFDKIISTIDLNNLKCYSNLILGNPTIYDFENNNLKYYGLSSISDDLIDRIPSKNGYGSVIPFLSSNNFQFLDKVTTGQFIVKSTNDFKYFCADENALYIFESSFDSSSSLSLQNTLVNEPYYDIIHGIFTDNDTNRMFIVNNDDINIYDTSNFDICDDPILIDKLPLVKTTTTEYIWNTVDTDFDKINITWNTKYTTINPNNPEFIKFGLNLRTSLSSNVLTLYNKYSSEKIKTIDLEQYDLGELIAISIRNVDDCILILNKKSDGFYVCFFDVYDITNTLYNKPIYGLSSDASNYKIEFAFEDSNVFSVSNDKEYHYHYISAPQYPSGRLEVGDFHYVGNFIWNTTYEKYNIMPIFWNYDNSSANTYNNLVISSVSKFDKMFMIVHNKGRIYTMFQPMNSRFLNLVPLDLVKYFEYLDCSETSLGVNFNVILSNILKDVLNMFNQSTSSANFTPDGVELTQIANFNLDPVNLHLNGNETVNVVAFQRIMKLITDIQRKLLPTSS